MPDEEADLLATAEALAAVTNSLWEPTLVSDTFSPSRCQVGPWSLGPFTLGAWLALDRSRSPYLHPSPEPAELSEEDRLDREVHELADAINAFTGASITADQLCSMISPEEGARAQVWIRSQIDAAWRPTLRMLPPGDAPSGEASHNGFGLWLILRTRAIVELRVPRDQVMDLPVGPLLAELACNQRNHGWTVAGPNYLEQQAGATAPAPVSPQTEPTP